MEKNSVCARKQTIRVLGADGDEVGSTYPRRAAGLVKKGRACYVNDFTIRLDMSDTVHQSEGIEMDNTNIIIIETGNKQEEKKVVKLYFNAREWKFNRDCSSNVGDRSFMEGPDGELAEAYMIGDWDWKHWTEIVSETLLLPKQTECSFTFWLNGGENDRSDEVCRFEVILNNNYEQRYTFNLNRNYIRPLKKLNGWELYEIPFRTLDNEYTQLRFVAQKAYMTVMAAKDVSAYANFPDNPDPFEDERPQRHNLVFADGFPKNNWYSTEQMMKKHGMTVLPGAQGKKGSTTDSNRSVAFDEICKKMNEVTEACEEIQKFNAADFIDKLRTALQDALTEEEDANDLVERMVDEVEATLTDSVEDVRDALEDVQNSLEDLYDQMEDEDA